MAGHQHLHERFCRAVALFAFDEDFIDVARIKVPDRTFDQVPLFIDQCRRGRSKRQIPDLVPQTKQVFIVTFDFGFRAVSARRADDHSHTFRNIEVLEDVLQPAAVGDAGDFARYAAAPPRIGHQDAISSGQG